MVIVSGVVTVLSRLYFREDLSPDSGGNTLYLTIGVLETTFFSHWEVFTPEFSVNALTRVDLIYECRRILFVCLRYLKDKTKLIRPLKQYVLVVDLSTLTI